MVRIVGVGNRLSGWVLLSYSIRLYRKREMMSRIIVDPNDTSIMLSREHVLGYLHALEEFTTMVDKNVDLSDANVAAYHGVMIDCLDELRIKAARDLGRLELTNNAIWMDD